MNGFCRVQGCTKFSKTKGLCIKHYTRLWRYGDVNFRKHRANGEGHVRKDGYFQVVLEGKDKLEHVVIAERVLGKQLPSETLVHHIDENRLNNAHNNLLICPDNLYHQMIHRRMRSLRNTGNINSEKCWVCKKYDDISNLKKGTSGYHHNSCKVKHNRELLERRQHIVLSSSTSDNDRS